MAAKVCMVLGPWARRLRFPPKAVPLKPEDTITETSPGTFVMGRRYEPEEHKSTIEGFLPRCHGMYDIYDTHRIYDCFNAAPPPLPRIDLLLIKNVDELGVAGDVVPVQMNKVTGLIVSDRAVYNSPYNRNKFSALIESLPARKTNISVQVMQTARYLSLCMLPVTMSTESSWTLEPWHMRVCFRKAGVHLSESCIKMLDRPISGPDMDRLDNKVFIVHVTINGGERVAVRCRIHHVTPNVYRPFSSAEPMTPVFPEDAELLASLPPVAQEKKPFSSL